MMRYYKEGTVDFFFYGVFQDIVKLWVIRETRTQWCFRRGAYDLSQADKQFLQLLVERGFNLRSMRPCDPESMRQTTAPPDLSVTHGTNSYLLYRLVPRYFNYRILFVRNVPRVSYVLYRKSLKKPDTDSTAIV